MRTIALAIAMILVASAAQAQDELKRGEYLATAAHCSGCHTAPGGAPYAGGRPLKSNLGTLISANITPDAQTGIGAWTPDQFYRALHRGRDDRGRHLYPAMPYNYYTRVTRTDADDIFAYLKTVPAVRYTPGHHRLPFPLNIRGIMGFWNLLYFRGGELKPEAAKSAEWNRGAYLVEGLAHCGGCHTPLGGLGAPKESRHLRGGEAEGWKAPDITPAGLKDWTAGDIVALLKTAANAHTTADGPMAEVVAESTSKLTDGDLAAIALYLAEPHAPRQ